MTRTLHKRVRRLEQMLASIRRPPVRAQPDATQVRLQLALRALCEEDLELLPSAADVPEDEISDRKLAQLRYQTELGANGLSWRTRPELAHPSQVLLEEALRWRKNNKLYCRFPERGPFRRELYPKHLEFFRAGADETERCFMAGNRVGKTEAAAYEVTLHLTGWYPGWWEGRRFCRPIKAWAVGETAMTVRDIVQEKLLGPPGAQGTGMIPAGCISKVTRKRGIAEAVDSIYVRHASGGISVVTLKSYQEGRESFQGTGIDVVWLDEEVPEDVYVETLTRLMSTNGILMLTFTPLKGLTPVVLRFLPAID